MATERKLLAAALGSREAFNRIAKHVGTEDLTEPGRVVFGEIDTYYARDTSADHVDVETLRGLLGAGVTNPKHKETFDRILDNVANTDVSGLNYVAEIIAAKREAVANKLATALAGGDHKTAGDLISQYEQLNKAEALDDDDESDLLNAPTVDDLLGSGQSEHLIQVYPRALNQRLEGGLLRGHHLVVFARPEVGKTMAIINMVYGFLRQGLRVLYVMNEEPIEDVAIRVLGRMSRMSRHDILEDRQGAYEAAMEVGYTNLWMKRLTPGTAREIESLVDDIEPDVLIVDQLRNLHVREENYTRQLEIAAQAVRRIAGKHGCLAVSVTQAGDSASGKAVLDMGDVDFSNTGIPAQADVMLGIGMTQEDEAAGRRMFALPKNKRSGRHDYFPVSVEQSMSKITSLE